MTGKYRHELKYQITQSDYLAIRQRIGPVMKTDAHSDENGQYSIFSVYFDNIYDKALLEKINGVQKREKFRIRYYNNDFSFIMLEKKSKYNDLCQKESARISKAVCALMVLAVMLLFLAFAAIYKRRPGKG